MRVIPVLDVRQGRAVRALAGDRAHYGPLVSVLHPGTDPATLARLGRDAWSLPDLYLADLDAILGQGPPDLRLFRVISDLGLTLWVDAGVRDPGDVPALLDAGVGRVVVGLETVEGPEALAGIVARAGADRVVFSLDLYQGRPMIETRAAWGTDRPDEIVARAVEAGVVRIIHLDVARVGTGLGPAFGEGVGGGLEGRVEWIVGGGIAGIDKVRALRRIGACGVLVGSALHDGRIGVAELGSLSGRRTS